MEENKVIVDRARLNSDYIAERQDFNQILKAHRAAKPSLWKSSWFYGPVGLAVVAVTVAAAKFNPSSTTENENAYEAKITLNESSQQFTKSTSVLAQTSPLVEPEPESMKVESSTSNKVISAEAKKVVESPKTQTPEVNSIADSDEKQILEQEPEVFLEVEPEPVKPTISANPGVPKIGGVFNGRIKADLICSSGVIEMNEGWYVLSYTIQYYNGMEDVIEKFNTDLIPTRLCSDLKRFNTNSPVNITSIVAENLKGERKLVPSMQITPVY